MVTKSGKRLRKLVEKRYTRLTFSSGRVLEGIIEFRGIPQQGGGYYFCTRNETVRLHANYSRRGDRVRVYDGKLFESAEQLEKYKQEKSSGRTSL